MSFHDIKKFFVKCFQISLPNFLFVSYKLTDAGTCVTTNPAAAKFKGEEAPDPKQHLTLRLKNILQDVEVQTKWVEILILRHIGLLSWKINPVWKSNYETIRQLRMYGNVVFDFLCTIKSWWDEQDVYPLLSDRTEPSMSDTFRLHCNIIGCRRCQFFGISDVPTTQTSVTLKRT